MANKNESSNSTMITLIVIVIIALGVLFFLKPFGSTYERTPSEEIRKVEINNITPADNDVKPVSNPPVKRSSQDKK